MTTNMNEMQIYMKTKPSLSVNTQKTYLKNYANLLRLLGSDDVHSVDPQEIINEVKSLDNFNTQNMYITSIYYYSHYAQSFLR